MINEALNEFLVVADVLLADYNFCQEQLTKYTQQLAVEIEPQNNTIDDLQYQIQFWRRAFARSLYAAVEGNIYGMKQVALAMQHEPGLNFSEGELVIMQEKAYELKDDGKVRSTNSRLRFLSNFRFALDVYTRATQIPLHIDYGVAGWEAFRTSIKLRDRLTHPKKYDDVEVTLDESMTLTFASLWFSQIMQEVMYLTHVRINSTH